MDKLFYKIVKPITTFLFKILFRPTIKGIDNIPNDTSCVLAGNHTKWLDPIMLVAISKRQVHFLAKKSLFKGPIGLIVKGMGAIPVDRSIHDKNALNNAINELNNNCVIGVFPEGTINKGDNPTLPFKIGAVKMAHDTNSYLVPFIITGKYKLFRKKITVEFLPKRKISSNLTLENEKLEKTVASKIGEYKNGSI